MRIALLYNETAGDRVSLLGLRREMRRHGHEVTVEAEKKSGFFQEYLSGDATQKETH